jgi:5-methylcytosine-specific restriction endonuclease McrA
LPEGSDGDVLAYVLKFFLDKKDPLRKRDKRVTSAPEVRKSETATSGPEVRKSGGATSEAEVRKRIPIRAAVRRTVLKRTNGACAFIDPITKKTCGSRHQIEIDHILPLALGGDNQPENLRTLCREHNRLMAQWALGRPLLDSHSSPKTKGN